MKADVIVVGAGPAGCSAAYHAARAGLEVLLLDQHESRQDRADGEPCSRGRSPKCHSWASPTGSRGRYHYKYEGIVVHARTARVRGPNSPANRHGVRRYVIPWFEPRRGFLRGPARPARASGTASGLEPSCAPHRAR